jgi:hypothetical protein
MNISLDGSTPEIGGLVFFLNNLADYLPYNIISVIGSIFGIFGWFNLVINKEKCFYLSCTRN